MAQLVHLEVADTATDISAGLTSGACFVCQSRNDPPAPGVLFASAVTAPSNDLDYFTARGGEYFSFTAGSVPVWCKSAIPGVAGTVSLARV